MLTVGAGVSTSSMSTVVLLWGKEMSGVMKMTRGKKLSETQSDKYDFMLGK